MAVPKTRPKGILPVCPICIATGRCSRCDGHGWRRKSDDAGERTLPCSACQSSGRCVYCKGRGKLISPA